MFTGIVQLNAPVVSVIKRSGLLHVALELGEAFVIGLERGASVAVDGVCLTALDIKGGRVAFDVMQETLEKTSLSSLAIGRRVNVERSTRFGDEVGGHVVSGHVTGVGEIIDVRQSENNQVVTFRVPQTWMKYILPKGFIALDGASLTIVDVDRVNNTFTVALIPETLRLTTFGWKREGDRVNVEIDSRTQAIVDTVENYLSQKNVG